MNAQVISIPISSLRRSPFQPRLRSVTKTDVADLMESMEAAGQTTPIVVEALAEQENAYSVHQGERRWTAAKCLGWEKISAIVRTDLTPMTARKVALADNFGRADLTAYEKAKALADYQRDCDTNLENAASQLGIGRTAAFELQNIWKASHGLKDVLAQSNMSTKAADLLTRLEKSDPKIALRKARALQAGTLTVSDLETTLKDYRRQKPERRVAVTHPPVNVKVTPTTYRLNLCWLNHLPSSDSQNRILAAMKEMLLHMRLTPEDALQSLARL